MTLQIVPIQTGTALIKPSQARAVGHGAERMANIFADPTWTPPLPILAWAIVHPDGVFVVDTGETARAMEPGYYPEAHPYYKYALRVQVTPEEEIGARLADAGFAPRDVRSVLLTHLHTDHSGGLHHFPESTILVHEREWQNAQGDAGIARGYLRHRWPSWFAPQSYTFADDPIGPFPQSQRITADGSIRVVPTPGHTPGHASVIVQSDGVYYFLAGDATYAEETLLEEAVDGVSPDEAEALQTIRAIGEFVREFPTVYLPTHDVRSVERLQARQFTRGAAGSQP